MDTNILVRLANAAERDHERVRRAIDAVIEDGDELVLVPQVLYEFWNVATRTQNANGLELPNDAAMALFDEYAFGFPLLPDDSRIFGAFRGILAKYGVRGVRSHDLRLVATMVAHGVPAILTLNTRDFRRYDEIELVAV